MLVFLDINGVMVPAKGWKKPDLLGDGFAAFSNKAINALRSLISEDTTIMLTTSHKSNYNVGTWKDIFAKRGINVEKIQVLDENINNLDRKSEIERWFLLNNTHEDFVVIDDDKTLNSLKRDLKSHLILTTPMIGLTDENLGNVSNITKGLEVVI